MKINYREFALVAFACMSIMTACGRSKVGELSNLNNKVEDSLSEINSSTSYVEELPTEDILHPEMKVLMEVYPEFVKGFKDNHLVFADDSVLLFDDDIDKSFTEMLDNSSLKNMFGMEYPLSEGTPKYLQDAGRSRNESLFKKMYGDSPQEVSKNLVTVDWFGQKLSFTKINGAAEQLKKVAEELSQYPELRKYLKSAGTYYWRKVRGSNRQSAHSYGIAIDIGVDYSDYWLWKYPKAKEEDKIEYANRMPWHIVEIFRKYGFIWGGAWYHFDTMHFEYRPEVLKYAEFVNCTNL